jgi:hypothetical protein
MNRNEIIEKLKSDVINIIFTKVDGTTRSMKATLSQNIVPGEATARATNRSANTTQAVWDTEASGWRSFKWDSIKEVNGVAIPNGVSVKG